MSKSLRKLVGVIAVAGGVACQVLGTDGTWTNNASGNWSASNNWAVDAARSSNGRPLLAGDPHQALTSPTRLWPLHMSSAEGGGSLDVIGFAFVGTPTVQLPPGAVVKTE